jgi:hypothetical protein
MFVLAASENLSIYLHSNQAQGPLFGLRRPTDCAARCPEELTPDTLSKDSNLLECSGFLPGVTRMLIVRDIACITLVHITLTFLRLALGF